MPVARYSENDENAGNKDECSLICCWTSDGDAQGDYPIKKSFLRINISEF